jgi:hypothetical protein
MGLSSNHAMLDGLNQVMEEPTAILCLEKDPRWLPYKAVVRGIQPGINVQDDLRKISQQGILFIQGLRSSV